MAVIRPEHIVERQGRQFVLYAGLLGLAHSQGLKAIRTHLIQIPSEDNGQVAVVSAEVETERGTFSGIGDASPANVSRMMLTATIRLAETRAKARALRDAVNVGMTAFEELGDSDTTEPTVQPPTPIRPVQPVPPEDTGELSTPQQRQAIQKLSDRLGLASDDVYQLNGTDSLRLTKLQASQIITSLQAQTK